MLICLIAMGNAGSCSSHSRTVLAAAFSLANNYVSQSNDLSAVLNPALMAFSPVVEFHVSVATGVLRKNRNFTVSIHHQQ